MMVAQEEKEISLTHQQIRVYITNVSKYWKKRLYLSGPFLKNSAAMQMKFQGSS